jgi:hypothetical protein
MERFWMWVWNIHMHGYKAHHDAEARNGPRDISFYSTVL